jgi:23S rRNA (cytidine1920-2'-O)/16S rRNA (cytidine1409-2'-O)-methyltransferase
VVALDVGHGQLHWKIRQDPRVEVREKVNARSLLPDDFSQPFDLIVGDVSFISLRLIIPPALSLLRPEGQLCVLIKPQFEAGKGEVGKGGILRDESVRERVITELRAWIRSYPVEDRGVLPSPITGTDGNQEYLWGLRLKG